LAYPFAEPRNTRKVSTGRTAGYSFLVSGSETTDRIASRLEPAPGPGWENGDRATAERLGLAFERDTPFTVGAEEELMLVDPDSWKLVPAVDAVLARTDGDARFMRELRESQIEIVTPVVGNAQALGIALAAARLDLARRAVPEARISASGTHPWDDDWGEIAIGERYRQIAHEFPWAAAGSLPCGLHVHVAVPGAERALAIYNAVRSYLPELAALSANSPYLAGKDTGLASSRRTLNDAFHRTGIPPAFEDWEAFTGFVRWGQIGGVFPDAKFLWWDIRPHTAFGTLELRVADAQTRVQDTVAIVAVFQSLVASLSDEYDRRGRLDAHPTERIAENAYRAVRYGVRGWMVDLDNGVRETTRNRIRRMLDRIEATASTLGNYAALLHARSLVADNGAERQRYVVEHAGDTAGGLRELVEWLACETVASADELLDRRL
jgi:carboxylate-amine ligase